MADGSQAESANSNRQEETAMNRLNDKVAIVTGAARGIGLAIAQRLASEGAKVELADIQIEVAEKSAAAIRASGGNAIAVRLDVTSYETAVAAADRVEKELGPIDVLVNNAGWDVVKPFLETKRELRNKIIVINYLGPRDCRRSGAQRMQAGGPC